LEMENCDKDPAQGGRGGGKYRANRVVGWQKEARKRKLKQFSPTRVLITDSGKQARCTTFAKGGGKDRWTGADGEDYRNPSIDKKSSLEGGRVEKAKRSFQESDKNKKGERCITTNLSRSGPSGIR